MKKMKKLTALLLALVCIICLFSGCGGEKAAEDPADSDSGEDAASADGAASGETLKWSLATSSSGSAPNTLGSILANVLNQNQDMVEISAQVTAGFNENLYLVKDGETDLGMGTCLDLAQAYTMQEGFEDEGFKDLRLICLYAIEYGHQITRADSGIKTFDDLTGKKLNINTPSSVTATRNKMLIAGAGKTLDDYKIFEIATSGAMDGLRDETFDATFNGMSIGNASVTELASQIPVHLIDIPEDVFENFNELAGGAFGYGVIPAGSYNGQDEDCHTWIGYNMLYTHADADEEAIYQLCKTFWESLEELGGSDAGFAALTPDMADFGPDVPWHPGAERYLKEIGCLQ